MLTIPQIKQVVSKVGKKYGIKRAYLFGSYAKGEATENSDVDLLIDRGEVKTYKDYIHLCDELENELGKNVDLLAEDGIRPSFFELIKGDRVLLYGA